MTITKNSFDAIKITDILAMGFDIIVKYELDNGKSIKTIPILIKHLSSFLENNLGEFLIDLLNYYLYTKKTIKILKIMKYEQNNFKIEDFMIKILTRRIYGDTVLLYVNIFNRKTGVFLEDWVRSNQIKSIKELNQLICWECEGEEINFLN